MKAVKMDVEGRRVEVEVECAERTIWASAEGRQRLHIHGWESRSWRHLDTCGFATVISPHCSHAISFDVSGKISEPVNSVGAGLLGLVSLGR